MADLIASLNYEFQMKISYTHKAMTWLLVAAVKKLPYHVQGGDDDVIWPNLALHPSAHVHIHIKYTYIHLHLHTLTHTHM